MSKALMHRCIDRPNLPCPGREADCAEESEILAEISAREDREYFEKHCPKNEDHWGDDGSCPQCEQEEAEEIRSGNWFGITCAIMLLCLPAFGQAAYSGVGLYSGSAAYGSPVSGGAPLTYSARTDNCVHGYSLNAPTAFPFYDPTVETCTPGATTGEAGSAMLFQNGLTDPLPFNRLDADTSSTNCPSYSPPFHTDCAVAGVSFTDPDFGSYNIFLTDQTTQSAAIGFAVPSGSADLFGIGYANDVMFTWVNGGSVNRFAHILEANFLAHSCATSPCVVKSNVTAASCTPKPGNTGAGACTQYQMGNTSSTAFSRNPNDPPNTLYEGNLPLVIKDTFTTGSPMGVNDSVARAAYVDFSSDSAGTIPCHVVASDYQSYWTSIFSLSNGGALTLASAGGGSYQTISEQPGVTLSGPGYVVGPDVFIMPVNNQPTGNTWMFQASAGTTGGTEPNWASGCATQGSTCTDGSASWKNIGKVASQGPGFDVLYFNPTRGCRRINTRLAKIYNGTNEGPNWPSTGTADTAGQLITNDAVSCFKMGGSNCGTGGTVNFIDKFTLHAAGSYYSDEYGSIGVSGGGELNKNYTSGGGAWPEISATANGSCTAGTVRWTDFASWPNATWSSANSYASGDYVWSPTDHNYYTTKTAISPGGADPISNSNWTLEAGYCYAYVADWYSNLTQPTLELGPDFGADGHAASTYGLDLRGGAYFQHYFNQLNCPENVVSPYCNGTYVQLNGYTNVNNNYVGAPNPGIRSLTVSLPTDGHPSSRNDPGTGALYPVFIPTGSVPTFGGATLPPQCGGGSGESAYCAAGYGEILAFMPDGSQLVYRFGHNWSTGSNPGFGVQNSIGVISHDGKMLAYTSDFMNTRGDKTGAATCVSPLRGQYAPSPNQPVTYLDSMLPVTHNSGGDIYQAAGFWNSSTSTYTYSGSGAEGPSIPNWDSGCPNVGNYCTTDGTTAAAPLDGNVLWKNLGPNSCRADIGLMDVTSALAAP